MAAQFTATNAPEACGPLMWMARATTSLPVPDSPWTSTVAELPATRASNLYTSSMAGLWPTTADGPTAGGPTRGGGTRAPPRTAPRRSRPRRRPRESARAPMPPYPALRTGPRAPCELVESSPRAGATQIPGDQHERIIRAFAMARQDVIGELLRRRLGRQCLREALPDPVGREDERIAGGDGEDDGVGPRQLGPYDAAARHQTGPRRARPRSAVAVQQQTLDVADAEPRHRPLGSREQRHAHHHAACPLQRPVAALDEGDRRFGRVSLEGGDGGLRRRRRLGTVAESIHHRPEYAGPDPLDEMQVARLGLPWEGERRDAPLDQRRRAHRGLRHSSVAIFSSSQSFPYRRSSSRRNRPSDGAPREGPVPVRRRWSSRPRERAKRP